MYDQVKALYAALLLQSTAKAVHQVVTTPCRIVRPRRKKGKTK